MAKALDLLICLTEETPKVLFVVLADENITSEISLETKKKFKRVCGNPIGGSHYLITNDTIFGETPDLLFEGGKFGKERLYGYHIQQ